jgi:hypothetical protein
MKRPDFKPGQVLTLAKNYSPEVRAGHKATVAARAVRKQTSCLSGFIVTVRLEGWHNDKAFDAFWFNEYNT